MAGKTIKPILKVVLLFLALVLGLTIYQLMAPRTSMYDLRGKDTYEGLPVYQYNVEEESVVIDGTLYKEVDDIPMDYIGMGDRIGYIWYEPHYRIEGGVIYKVYRMTNSESGEYLYAESPPYKEGRGDTCFGMHLKRAEDA